ncbi:hypothetical protein JCM11641_000751 [Rhodosporidiobolus odoratus]
MVGILGLLASLAQAAAVFPRGSTSTISTPHGSITGLSSSAGTRFTVPYARPPIGTRRMTAPVEVKHFSFLRRSYRRSRVNRRYDGTGLPKACPQLQMDPSEYSEDCLYFTVYSPPTANLHSRLPVLFWIHGGSFHQGQSAGLDGAALAKSQNMVVVVVQYRLGILGWLNFDKYRLDGNNGLRDVIMALQFVKSDIAAYGGDASRVTLAGQSSGAEIIKTLLVTPSAAPLFARAILQSAPLDTVDQPRDVANQVGQYVITDLKCRNWRCLQTTGLDALLVTQDKLVTASNLQQLGIPGVAQAEPLRVMVDGSLVPRDFREIVSAAGKVASDKEILFSTVKDEGCLAISTIADGPLPAAYFPALVQQAFTSRADTILSSGLYDPSLLAGDEDAVRNQLVRLVTDFTWVCPNKQAATSLSASQKVYLAEFDLGVSYLNGAVDFCKGRVDHQDDIFTLFTSPYPLSATQKALSAEVQARWAAFARNGSPNTPTYFGWYTVSAAKNELDVIVLGADSKGNSVMKKDQRNQECAIYSFA